MDIVWPIMVKRGHNLFYGPTSEIYFIYFLFGLVTCHQPDYDYGFYVQFCYIIFTFNIICFTVILCREDLWLLRSGSLLPLLY